MIRAIAIGILKILGVALLVAGALMAAVAATVAHSHYVVLETILFIATIVYAPVGLGYLFILKADQMQKTQDYSFTRKLSFFLIFICAAIAFGSVFRVSGPSGRFFLLILLLWAGAMLFYLRVLDGWSTLDPATRDRLTTFSVDFLYVAFQVSFTIVTAALFPVLPGGGSSGSVSFGGGASGGGGAIGSW